MSTHLHHLGKYELRERLGRGSMTEVWKAFDTQLQRLVAIKLLHADLRTDPQFMNRFIREARVVAALQHPNIVHLHDFRVSEPSASEEGVAYMVMEYIEGKTLADYIHNTSALGKFPSAAEIVHLFASLGSAIDYAHQHGMIHRDIRPANILLDKHRLSTSPIGEPVLTDFGIAKVLSASTGSLSGAWHGSPGYISPEQATGAPGTERSDLYSLGVILYEICTGRLPFQENNPTALLMLHVNSLPTPPDRLNAHIPPALNEVILRSIAKDPAARFADAASLVAALAAAFNIPVPAMFSIPNTPTRTPLSYQSLQPNLSPGITPSLPLPPPVQRTPATPPFAVPSSNAPVMPPLSATPSGSSVSQHQALTSAEQQGLVTPTNSGARETRVVTPAGVAPVLTPPRTPPIFPAISGKRRRRLFIPILIALLILLIGSSLATWFLFLRSSPKPVTLAPGTLVGHAFFLSSGALNESSARGIEDQVQITLNNIPDPAAGKSYYAWLLNDKAEKQLKAVFLGKLNVSSGHVNMLYTGDSQYTNLIATNSRFLVTQEDASKTLRTPSLDRRTWSFYGEIPQIPSPVGRHFSALIHIRHMLYEGPILSQWGIHGGGNLQLFKNTQKILEWAESARDSWGTDSDFVHRQVIRILDYIDGSPYINQDVPPGTPLLVDPRLAQVPLITVVKGQNVPSYLSRIGDHVIPLTDESQTPGITPAMRTLAMRANVGLTNEQQWVEHVRQDAKQLVMMDNTQLLQPTALLILNDMQVWANYAFVGRVDPSTNEVQWGAVQIYYGIQQLANFDVRVFK
jgi:serine/threonine protein kinase